MYCHKIINFMAEHKQYMYGWQPKLDVGWDGVVCKVINTFVLKKKREVNEESFI